MNEQPNKTRLDAQYRTLLILWAGFLSTITIYLFLPFVIGRGEAVENRIVATVLTTMAALLVLVSFLVKRRFFSRSVEAQDVRHVNTGFIIAAALCEAAAMFGLLDFLVAHDRYYFLPIGFSFIGLLLHFPRRKDLEAASYKRISLT
ncbi:MAG TPA: hypothetical protein VK208_14665 [Pyrinomonadaceae bacterium]|jgi:F0F1-type ATP synthase membrane subunit c/vacuolar-type H+-ATPase subunit K|nr:hypothetical protein [Pyrinomonadaceae bacterium]